MSSAKANLPSTIFEDYDRMSLNTYSEELLEHDGGAYKARYTSPATVNSRTPQRLQFLLCTQRTRQDQDQGKSRARTGPQAGPAHLHK